VTRALETLEKKTFHEDFWNKRVFVFVAKDFRRKRRIKPALSRTLSRALSLRSLFFRVRLHSATVGMGSFGSRI
jgi:hypothetical protein